MSDSTADHAEALALIDRFRAAGEPSDWQAEFPADDARQRALAEAFDRIGVEAFNAGDTSLAQHAFWHLFLLRLRIVTRQPQDRADIRDFATAEDLLGRVLLDIGTLGPAEQMLSEALKYRRGLYEDEPTDAHAAYLHGVALWHMARLERAKGNASSETGLARQARDRLVMVDASWPGVSFITRALADVQQRLAEM